jgi:membrane protein DedA with SNARE-associated domain
VSFAWTWLAEYSYAFVLAAATIDAMALPFPGRLVLVAGGVLAAAGRAEIWGVLAAGVTGAVIGDHLWYFAGRLARGRIRTFLGWLAGRAGSAGPDAVEYLRRRGGAVILVGRFVATVRVLVWPVAGAHGIGYGRFLAWEIGAATLWAGLFVLAGYILGRPAFALMDRWGGLALAVAGVGLSLLAAGMLVWRRRQRGPRRGHRAGSRRARRV